MERSGTHAPCMITNPQLTTDLHGDVLQMTFKEAYENIRRAQLEEQEEYASSSEEDIPGPNSIGPCY